MKKTVSIIGGGPSAFALAYFLDSQRYDVSIFERNKSLGRKFLVAGKGGFNLTHSEAIEQFIERYTPTDFLKDALTFFDNIAFRKWLADLGIPTVVGSSKRVYPEKDIKPIEVLRAITNSLEKNGVHFKFEHRWTHWSANQNPVFNESIEVPSDIVIFALGGGSWKVTGSDGNWLEKFKNAGIKCIDFEASNCSYQIKWDKRFIGHHAGKPLKNISLSSQNQTQKGEVNITRFGLEGNAIYALSPRIRKELNETGTAQIFLDLKPALTLEKVLEKLKSSSNKNISTKLKEDLKLDAAQIALLKSMLSKEAYLNPQTLATNIKNLQILITGIEEVNQAISTVGGVALDAVDENFQMKVKNNQYCLGEMLDWDAPTGGYLLQACFSMGAFLAHHLNTKND